MKKKGKGGKEGKTQESVRPLMPSNGVGLFHFDLSGLLGHGKSVCPALA
jgi:hypothetical protein